MATCQGESPKISGVPSDIKGFGACFPQSNKKLIGINVWPLHVHTNIGMKAIKDVT